MSQSIFEWTHFISASCQKFFSNIDDITKIVNVAVCTYLRPAILFLMQILSFWIRKLPGLKSFNVTGVRININVTDKNVAINIMKTNDSISRIILIRQIYKMHTFFHLLISRIDWYLHINFFPLSNIYVVLFYGKMSAIFKIVGYLHKDWSYFHNSIKTLIFDTHLGLRASFLYCRCIMW